MTAARFDRDTTPTTPTAHHATTPWRLHVGDALDVMSGMAEESVDSIVTSPPYWGLRNYGPGQYGHEPTVELYLDRLRAVFTEARRLLARDGTLWLNLGDSYGGSWHNYVAEGSTARTAGQRRGQRRGHHHPPQAGERAKNLLGLPWRVALRLVEDGWLLRNAIVWHKPNAMPESVTDRLSCRYEMLFLLVKNRRYWFDLDPIRETLARPEALTEGIRVGGQNKTRPGPNGASARRQGHNTYGARQNAQQFRTSASATGTQHRETHHLGRNPGDMWSIPTRPYRGAHIAASPIDIPLRCIAAGCKPDGTVLDPFSGAGTTGLAALQLGRKFIGIDIRQEFCRLAEDRFLQHMDGTA